MVYTEDTYLIFSIHQYRYALRSSLIKEIMYASKIHKIPFVPHYIEGMLNCRGNPYTVVNTLKLDGDENPEITEAAFVVINRDDDQFCIRASNIEKFYEPEENDVFEDKIKVKGVFVPLFDTDRIEETLCRDLSRTDI